MSKPKSAVLRMLLALNVALLAATAAFAWLTYEALPKRVPIHFDLSGHPNRFADKGFEVIVLYLLPFFLTALLHAAAWMVSRRPQAINLPNKEKFLALPPERREPVYEVLCGFFYAQSASINLLLLSIIIGITLAAQSPSKALSPTYIFPGLGLVLLTSIVGTIVIFRSVAKATDDKTKSFP